MAPDLRRAETAGLARFTPLSKRLQMTNWVGCSTNRDVVPQSCTPTMDEQRRLWDWRWQNLGGRSDPHPPRRTRRPPDLHHVCSFAPLRPQVLELVGGHARCWHGVDPVR